MSKHPRIFINLDGGIIQQIITDVPVEVIVADFDTQDLEEDRITRFKDESGEDAEASIWHEMASDEGHVSIEPEVVDKLFKNIEAAEKE